MVLKSLQQAFNALFNLRTWLVVLLPPLIAGFTWIILFIIYWHPLYELTAGMMAPWAFFKWLDSFLATPLIMTSIFASTVLLLIFIPVLFVVILLVTSIFVTPLVQREVAVKYFPHLEKKRGGSVAGSLWNSLTALFWFVTLFIFTFPLWLIPGMQLLIPASLIIWMNKKIFLYDVLQDFASKEERQQIAGQHAGGLWGMGALLVVFSYLPLAFVILPVFSAFAYSFYALQSLETLRKTR